METALIIYTQGTNTPCVMDLYQNETIALQYSFSDIKELKPRATYSKTFRIPATKNNSSIFGFIENNTFQFSQFNPKRKFNAILSVDTLPIMEGNIQFKAAYTANGVVSEYEIVFFGNVIDFFKNVGDADFKNFIAVELQNDYGFIVDYPTVSDIISGTYGDGNIDITLTDRGNNWVGSSNQDNTRTIYANPVYNINNPSQYQDQINQIVKIGELTPMVKAEYIFNKIIELSGFSYDAANSTTLSAELAKLFIPFTSETNMMQQVGDVQAAKFKLENGINGLTFTGASFTPITLATGLVLYHYPIPNLTEVFDPNGYVTSNVFTAPFSGEYTIKCNINLEQNADGLGGFMLGFLIQDLNGDYRLSTANSTGAYFANFTSGTTFPQYQQVYAGINNAYDNPLFLLAGETLQPIFWELNPNPISAGVTITFRDAATAPYTTPSTFFCDYVSKPMMGNEIDWVANAPVMKCTEFMSAIFKMFNLVVIPDSFNAKLLSFIPIQEYISSGTTKDWSNKIDISKDIILTPTTDYQAQINTWTYKQSTDYLNNIYNTEGNRIYGRLQLLDPENDFATQEQKIELEFGSTPLALIAGTDYPIAKFINDKAEYVNPTPRILFRTGDTMEFHIWNDDTNVVDNAFVVPLFSHYQSVIPNWDSNDYNFGQETPLHPVNQIPVNTLYARFWNDYIQNIYAPDARILEAFFALEFADIYNFKYNDKIFIRDSYWRILEISDYVVGMQESVKVKLMKVIEVAAPCNLTIDSVDTSTLNVLFIDSEGNISSGTQQCCEAYGYNWNATQGRCYPVRQDGGSKKQLVNDKVNLTKEVAVNTDKLLQVPNNFIDLNNMHSIVGGMNNFLGANNDGSLVNGNKNFITSDLGSVNVMGESASVINKGLTIGGGGSYTGQVQSGIVHLFGSGNFTNNTTYINLKIDGTTAYNIPTNTNWILKILLSGLQNTGADGTITGEYNIHVVNRGGTVLFINATTIDETFDNMNGYLVFDLVISGETFYPRIKLVGSSTYPENTMQFSALTTYTQYHYE